MIEPECVREREVIHAIIAGAWPDAVDLGLQDHAARCPVCSAVVELATSLRAERETSCENARIPNAAVAWWRAQLRTRQEATRTAGRPIAAAVAIALASLAGLVAAVVPAAWGWVHAWTQYAGELFGTVLPTPAASGAAPGTLSLPTVFWLGVIAWVVAASVALYFVLVDD